MEDEKMKELIIDYLDGNLTGELNDFVSRHIQKTDKWRIEYEQLKELNDVLDDVDSLEPPSNMKGDFEALLANEMASSSIENPQREAKVVYLNSPKIWLQIAASVSILMIGLYAGYKINNGQNQQEIAVLRQEMEATKQLVLVSLENQSASSRLNAVNVSNKMTEKDDEILRALVNTLNNDANANVRLAAMDALSKFADDELVRKALIESLAIQDKPVVQLALIDLMVNLKEERAKTILQEIANNTDVAITVRDEASYGLIRL